MSTNASDLIRKRRKARGLSLDELAALVGSTKSYQSLIESGKRSPSNDQLLEISHALDLPPDLLCVAFGKLPSDVERNIGDLAATITSLARTQTESRAYRVPDTLDKATRDLLTKAAASSANASVDPYHGDLVFGKNSGSYRTHSYHTKVPPEAIVPVIEHYTQPGDIVMDPFCGSGMTGVAALRSNRYAILSDLSPAAVHIARNYTTPCSSDALEEAFERLGNRLAPTMGWLYGFHDEKGNRSIVEHTTWSDRFECPSCGSKWTFWDAARGPDGQVGNKVSCPKCKREARKSDWTWAGEVPVESNVSQVGRRGRIVQRPSSEEIELIEQSNKAEIPHFVPNVPFEDTREMWRASHRAMGIESVSGFYTRRNLHALAALRHEILQEPDERIRAALLFAFTAIVNRASKRYQWNAKRPTNVMTGTLYVSSLRYEWNVWSLYQRKVRDAIRYYRSLPQERSTFADAFLASATDLSCIPDRSVDLVFMDPPFGSNIFYSDVSLLWEAWLGSLTDEAKEIVVSKRRRDHDTGKSIAEYAELLGRAFGEARRVLKPGAAAILVFSNTNDAVWEAIQQALDLARLEVSSTAILDKVHRSIKGVQADLGKQKVNRLDLMLELRPSHSRNPGEFSRRSGPLKDEVRTAVLEYLRNAGKRGAATDEVFSQVVKLFMGRRRNLRGISMSVIEDLCCNLADRGDDHLWRLKESLEAERFIRVDSPYGCAIEPHLTPVNGVLSSTSHRPPKRVAVPRVKSVTGSRNSAYYNAHSYPTKVPPEAIRPFIEHFTRPGDIVLDPFSGSGMTGIACATLGRRAILNDLSVAAAHLGFNHTQPCDSDELQEAFDAVYSAVLPEFRSMYSSTNEVGDQEYVHYTLWSRRFTCPECDKSFLLWDVIDQETGKIGTHVNCPQCQSSIRRKSLDSDGLEPVLVSVDSAIGKGRHERRVSTNDLDHIAGFDRQKVDEWFPDVPLGSDRDMYNLSALHLQEIHELADFYTPRNLRALSLLWREIQSIQPDRVRHALEFAFTNTAWHGTKMRRFNARGGQRPLTGTLYVPQLSSEVNVLEVMRNKVRQLCRYYAEYRPATDAVLPTIRIGSATNLSDVPNESIDYVFTDPPFGSNIYYADCNVVFESWLGGITDARQEAVVNRSIHVHQGGKSINEYQTLMTSALHEIWRVLKPKAWATLVFHNTNADVWSALQAAAVSAGFKLEHAAGLDRKQHSHKGYKGKSEQENVAHFDVVMSMRKLPQKSKVSDRPRADRETLERILRGLIDENANDNVSTQRLHSFLLQRLVVDGFDLGSVSYSSTKELREAIMKETSATLTHS